MTPLKVKQKLFEVRDIIHDLHLNSKSYSEHKALNQLYEGWTEEMDKFLETFYGKYGRIMGAITIDSNTEINVSTYLINVMVFLNKDIVTIIDEQLDSDLCNIIADMKQLINHTLYLLTLK